MTRLIQRAVSEGPPVIAAALLAEVFVPRLHSPLRELPYFFALWAVSAAAWNLILALVARFARARRLEER